ncbi:hypothetical protein ACXZ9C_11045 [Streptococcus agalactiae]
MAWLVAGGVRRLVVGELVVVASASSSSRTSRSVASAGVVVA